MKRKKVFSKILAIVLVLSLMLSAFPSISVFAQESLSKEKLTEKGELWQPESNSNALNFEGDLSIEELQSAKLNDEDTPEIVGQDNIEEKGHVNRLWEQEEDLNSIVFQNRDGTKTMYYYNYPVKYKDANGKIKDKSNKISQTSSGDYTNAENDINTYFPKKLNRNKGIELKFGEYVIEMAPDIKGNSGASRQTGHNKYFDPTEYVQYPNVFDESISLRYTPTFEGYKEDIVLSKYAGINEFSFSLYTDGLSLVMNEDGAYYLIDPLSGEVKTQIGDLVVYDSKPFDVPEEILNESVSNPTEEDFAKKEATLKELVESVPIEKNETEELPTNLKEYFHQYKVETVKQDNEYLITIVVDEEYLTDSERVYPVYVDPTISVSGSGTGKTIQDAPIYANKPSTASGGNTYNVVGYQGSTYGVGRTLMKFPGLSSNSTYANLSSNQITSLQLHIYEGSGSTNNACIDLWQYNGISWTESTARCSNIGWDSYSNNFTWNYINCSGWQTFDLTSMVATWKGSSSALDKGIMLKNYTSESSSGYSKHFMSTESSYKPYLTYTYNAMPTQVTLSQTSNTIGVGESFNLYATVSPSNTSQSVVWSSSDSSVATVSSGGLVCANGAGTTVITARSSLNSSVYARCTVNVIGPTVFAELESQGLLGFNDIAFTDDDFHITTKSLSGILNAAGISSLLDSLNTSMLCSGYFDDWYIFAVPSSNGYTYGLYKMREQESDSDDNNDPGVTISFIKFDTTLLLNCISSSTSSNKKLLYSHLNNVVAESNRDSVTHNTDIYNYFRLSEKEGPYLIIDKYIKFIGSLASNGYISVPNNYTVVYNDDTDGRVPSGVDANNSAAGYTVCDHSKVYISDANNLSNYEKYAIMMTHTANVNYNSFAAEVVFHARALTDGWSTFDSYYMSAIRADMAIGEEYEVAGIGVFDDYYDLDSSLVQEQVDYHGEK